MRTLHLISHTHWDREWHQTFQQFRLQLVHLVDGLLDILDADDAYQHFMLDGQTIVLDDYLEVRPERAADLGKYVQNGRILIGPWYILPDEFLVSPEATIRNLLEGDRIARRFGPKMMIGYIPDPFGHIGQMPQILRGFGIGTASVWRGVDDQPNEFWWEAPDGSRVLMGFLRLGYSNAAGILGNGTDGFVTAARSLRDLLVPHTRGNDLLLMHGVDHQEAQPGTSAAVAYAAGKLDGDRLIHSTLRDYFERIQASIDLASLPVVRGELRSPRNAPMLPGVLSTRMWIKQRNCACETLLEKWAEPFSAWAQVYALNTTCLREPAALLRQAWRMLMQCHPHDSICGCSIDQVHDEMRPRFDQVEQIGEAITWQSLEALASVVATRPVSRAEGVSISSAVIVFNPVMGPRSDAVTASVSPSSDGSGFDLMDESGTPIPFQTLGMGSGELFNTRMDRSELQKVVNMISAGTDVAGVKILGMQVRREGSVASIEVRAGQTGEPDLAAWESARKEILAWLKDSEVTTYHVHVRSVAASQVIFTARDVPGHGYRTYWVLGKAAIHLEPQQLSPVARALIPISARLAANPTMRDLLQRIVPDPASRPPYRIENEFFVVEAQPDGSLDVLDKRNGTWYRGQNRFVDGGDRGDEYNYSPPEFDRKVTARVRHVLVNRGEVQQTLELTLAMEAPAALEADRKSRSRRNVVLGLRCRVTLSAGVARVDIHTEIDNQAHDHRLRVHFAAPFPVTEAAYDGHFEIVRRPVGIPAADASWSEQPRPEAPQCAFCAVSDETNGLLIANRGLPEAEVVRRDDGNWDIVITLLRCVGWLSRDDLPERKGPAGPVIATPGAQMLGNWAFDYSIVPFREADRMKACHQAYAFEAPLRAMNAALQDGRLPAQGAFIRVTPDEFVVSTVKTTEDGQRWLVRGYNAGSQSVKLALNTMQPMSSIDRGSLAEEPISPLSPDSDGGVSLDIHGHEIMTMLFGN